ncbi:MAG: bifunctional oligoribonuclease/PAP phosphatase NrnA [Anaerolineae bacterium]|nr:bifunctional oligoribonuclease/PAP phosphatase NrnA [Anaerolineae bacterium]
MATHVSPDADAIGSLLALGIILRRLNVPRTLLSEDGLPYEADSLPGASEVVAAPPPSFDVAVLVDCPELERIGGAAERLSGVTLVNVDHHPTNSHFGHINLVDTDSLSTTQILHRLVGVLGLDLTADLAACLLAGLVADTQGFRIPASDRRALRTAEALMAAGASLWEANHSIFGSRPRGHVVLWGQVLSGAVMEGELVWSTIPLSVRHASEVPEGEDAGIVNFLLATRGTRAAAVFSERSDGSVDVSLRSQPGIDVAEVAAAFGGGGHRQAAGCTVSGGLAEVSGQVLARLRRAVNESAVRSSVS